MSSLRASLRRIPGITAVAVEMMETDLVIICGRDEGNMSREELMQFLQKALLYRPKDLSANAFLAHLRDIDAQSNHAAYGAFDVVKSTFRHWSNQHVDLSVTVFVVVIFACTTPVLAFFLKLLTDEGFPKSVRTFPLQDFDESFIMHLSGIYNRIQYKNESQTEDNILITLPFVPENSLLVSVIGILGVSVPFVICDYAMGYFQSKMIAKATQRLQQTLLNVLLHKPTRFFQERSDGDLNNLFQSDIARVNSMWQAVFWNLMQPIVSIVIGFGYLMYFEPILGIMSFSVAAILVTSGPQGLAGERSQEFVKKNAYVAAEFQNTVSCQKVVRAYEIQEPLLTRFAKSIRTLSVAQFAKDFWSGIVQIYIESAMFIFVSVMTACLAIKVYHGEITAGEFFSSVTLLSRVSSPVTILGGFMRVAIGNASSLQRLDEIVMGADEVMNKRGKEDERKPALPRMKKTFSLTNVCFSYTGDVADLDNISAQFKQGDYVCIVGPSGCGKSTLLSCLMQFQDIASGSVAIDGLDMKLYSKASYMDQIAVVFQDGGILNGTILDNIRYGQTTSSDQDCFEAAKAAECDDFIRQLKDGYQTIIGQHGSVNLSGGQTQRLCLARALVRKPSLLLLDEATSALDQETEAHIVATLERLARKTKVTVVSVTHRLSTTRNADAILVMDHGKIIESGKYKELMQKSGSFFSEMMHRMENTTAADANTAGRQSDVRATMENIYTMDLGNVLDTHRALTDFQHALNQRVDDKGDVSSAWQTRKRSASRGSSRGSLYRGSLGAVNTSRQSSASTDDRDSYIVM
ncbi:Aste57867_17077 [Aphanomyces stellatus]|uniref:Aste57867_17077 protein n=1 Tax=Aphanomyces stellatus TaxID=120398 RepID=A0A485L850_9STRA|nr:hypothetical protein As57867_017019 [Aphanomyces stellatus]VFT93837.1 Aste57867_17077 [Aphanomyces stellatus]